MTIPNKLIQDWAAAWSGALPLDRFLALFTDDAIYEDVAAAHLQRGKSEIEGFYRSARVAFPDFKVELTSLVAGIDRASAEWRMTGTQKGELMGLPATHKTISMRGISAFELTGGKIKRTTDYYNMAEMMKQLGLG